MSPNKDSDTSLLHGGSQDLLLLAEQGLLLPEWASGS